MHIFLLKCHSIILQFWNNRFYFLSYLELHETRVMYEYEYEATANSQLA